MGWELGEFVVAEERRGRKPPRRIWVQHVAVEADRLQTQVQAARQRPLTARQAAIADGVRDLTEKARSAALGHDPRPRRFPNWWRGTLYEAAYLNLHAARAQIIDLYDENELRAEIPTAVARAQSTLHRDDPRRVAAEQILQAPELQAERVRPVLRLLIGDSYEKSDREHAQLRSFRNILVIAATVMFVLVALTVGVVSWRPKWMPLCFGVTIDGKNGFACPTSTGSIGPRASDIIMIALLGALGGALTASLSIRNLKGTSTPYDVPVALATLKVPLGAFTAILALVAIQGGFVPGLSNLDSQEQILAYAVLFGFAQQALTRLLDRQAQDLMEGLPGGTATEPSPGPAKPPPASVKPGTSGTAVDHPAEVVPVGDSEDADLLGADEGLEPGEAVPGEDVPGEAITGEAVPGEAVPGEAVSGEAVSGEDDDTEGEPVHAPGGAELTQPPAEPMQAPAEGPDLDLLPDPDEAEFVEDGKAPFAAGPDAPDGVEFPTAETED